jgi:hypothetical protein
MLLIYLVRIKNVHALKLLGQFSNAVEFILYFFDPNFMGISYIHPMVAIGNIFLDVYIGTFILRK